MQLTVCDPVARVASKIVMATCRECFVEIIEDADECPNCESPLVEPLRRETLPVTISGRLIFAQVMAVAMLGWLCVQASLSWQAFGAGYASLLVPAWNSVVLLGCVAIVVGVLRRSALAQRWAVGVSALTALSLVYYAQGSQARILWIGIAILGCAALALGAAKESFTVGTKLSPTAQRALGLAAFGASLAVAFANS